MQANNELTPHAPSQRFFIGTTEPAGQKENTPVAIKSITVADRIILEHLLGQEAATQLVDLDDAIQTKKPIDTKSPPLMLGVFSDRQKRGNIHQVGLCP